MKEKFVFTLLLLCASCTSKYSKKNYRGAEKIEGSGCFLECYQTYSGGVFAGDSYSYYLTDSVNFRAFGITKYHDDELIRVSFNDGIVYLYKVERMKEDTIETKKLDVRKLVREKDWE